MLEQLYTDFTTKLLPQIQTGLAITKDYFLDLFGRYIKYLIIIDGGWTIIGLLLSLIGITCFTIFYKKWKNAKRYSNEATQYSLFLFISIIFSISGPIICLTYATNLAKDIYIPEIRIYEEIKGFNPRI